MKVVVCCVPPGWAGDLSGPSCWPGSLQAECAAV